MNCAEIQERLEAYILDLLPDDERMVISAHLSSCPECQPLAAGYTDSVAMLPVALALAAPRQAPTALRSRVLNAIQEHEAKDHANIVVAPVAAIPAARTTKIERPDAPRSIAQPAQAQPKSRFRLLWAAALLLMVLLLALGTGLTITVARENALQRQLAALSDQQQTILEVVDSPKTIKVHMRPLAGDKSTAYGKIYIQPDLPDVVVMAMRLPPAPANKAYLLWVTTNDHSYRVGELNVNSEGFAVLTYRAWQPGQIFDSAQLTLQASGSNEPGGIVILSGKPDPKPAN